LRVWPLRGRRLNDDAVELPIFALMGERLVGSPRLEDHIEGLVEPCIGLLHRHAEPGEFAVAVSLADAEIEAAAGQEIEGGGLFGQEHRVMPRQYDYSRAEGHPARAGAEPCQQVEGGRDLAVAGG